MLFIPYELDGDFTVKDFAKTAKISNETAGLALNILNYMGTVSRVGKSGNAYLYRI